MPPGGSISSVQSFAIMNWIAAGSPNSVAPAPSPSPTAVTGSALLVANEERLRIGNRLFIASFLQDIFGSAANAPVTKLVTSSSYTDVLGAPCNAYSSIGPIDYGQLSIGSDCASVASAQVAEIPISTTARGALLTRACDAILSQDSAVLNAASLALGTSMTASTLPAMDASSVSKAYGLFYAGRPLPTDVAADLLAVASAGENSMESWRFTLLALCYAPDWQIP
jgi:hypothetical protein